jgi:hypothetical protein
MRDSETLKSLFITPMRSAFVLPLLLVLPPSPLLSETQPGKIADKPDGQTNDALDENPDSKPSPNKGISSPRERAYCTRSARVRFKITFTLWRNLFTCWARLTHSRKTWNIISTGPGSE